MSEMRDPAVMAVLERLERAIRERTAKIDGPVLNGSIASFLPLLERWFGQAMAQVYSQPPAMRRGVLLMGAAVWGQKYLDRLQSWCLPSVVSSDNLTALRGRAHMVFFTDEPSFARLWSLAKNLEEGGITTQILLIPPEIMEYAQRDPMNRYWIIGVTGNVFLQMAGRSGMAFHNFFPDHVYARGYFPNLFRLSATHQAIVQPGISAEISTAWEPLDRFRDERGNLTISDVDLGTIGWQHMHAQTRASIMNAATIPDAMPNSHFLIWQGVNKLVIHCCHMNPAYLSPALVAKCMPRIPATIDAELPSFIPDGRFYVPTIEDGMTYLELSDGEKRASTKLVPFSEFSERCHTHVRFMLDWMPYFETPFEIPITAPMGMVDNEIANQFRDISDRLMSDRADAALRFIPRLAFQ